MRNNTAFAILRAESHTSASALGQYVRCSQQFFYQRIERAEPEHRSSALVFGSGLHRSLARYYAALRDDQPIPGADDLQTTFADYFRAELADGDRAPVLFTEREHPDKLLDLGVRLIDVFLAKVVKPHRVVGVEEEFLVELHDPADGTVLEERLLGVFDLVVQNPDLTHTIYDHKSAARKLPATRTAHDMQVSAYAYAAPAVGLGDADVKLQVLLKQKNADLVIYECPRNGRDTIDFLTLATGVLNAIRNGIHYKTPDWHCTSCPFKARCMAG
jgi:hypothetical protein